MLSDATQIPDDTEICDTLIVGSGAVGLTMAVDLARAGHSVCVVEAGASAIDAASQAYFEAARATGHAMPGLHIGRFRALGGTTHFWGGQLARFDPVVFRRREWVSDTAWPLTAEELEPHYIRVLDLLRMDSAKATDAQIQARLGVDLPPLPDTLKFFYTRWAPEPNFALLFREEIQQRQNLQVIINAPVVGLDLKAGESKLSGVMIVDKSGRRIKVRAKRYILANGTIEIARLLSQPLASGADASWSANPWLGKGFIDHIDCVAGDVRPIDKTKFHLAFDNARLDGVKYQPKLKLSQETQMDERLVGIGCHFIYNSSLSEHIANAKIFFKGLLKGRVNGSLLDIPRQIATLVRVGLPMIVRYLAYQRIYSAADGGIQLCFNAEQKVVLESGLRLRDDRDNLGMKLADLEWRIDGGEMDTIARFAETVAAYLKNAGLADVALDPRVVARDKSFVDTFGDTNHQMGMARMAADPDKGVVDPDLKVHGCDNLFVAGAAVFPTTGFPNPTFTAMALGLRLTEAIRTGRWQ